MIPKIYKDSLLSEFENILMDLKGDGIVLFDDSTSSFKIFIEQFETFLKNRLDSESGYVCGYARSSTDCFYYYRDIDRFSYQETEELIQNIPSRFS